MSVNQAYHVCFVVRDLDVTCGELSDLLGVEWAPVLTKDLTLRMPTGPVDVHFRYTFSRPTSGGCLFEIIEGPPGSIWDPGEAPWAFHHVGFWAADLDAVSGSIAAAGLEVEATLEGPEPLNLLAYHQLRHGPRIELVDPARGPSFRAWINEPSAADGGD